MFERELQTALELIQRAGAIAMEVYRRDFAWQDKSDDRGPVTEADRRVNEFLVDALRRAFPGDAVVGEESVDAVDLNAERLWIIDPVDGTKDFLRKNDEWSIMIGLSVGGEAVVGAVAQTPLDRIYVGSPDDGAWLLHGGTKTRLAVSTDADPRAATIVNSRSHPDPTIDGIRDRLGISREYRHGSVGCKLAHISERRADLYVNLSGKCHLWDVCGPEALIRAAGGVVTDLNGARIPYSGSDTQVHQAFLATTPALLPAVLDAARAVHPA